MASPLYLESIGLGAAALGAMEGIADLLFSLAKLGGGAIVLSGTYIAIEETIEKATVAELLPRESRSLGLGILASANAIGDMVSSVTVGLLLASGRPRLAFTLPALVSGLGMMWILVMARRPKTA